MPADALTAGRTVKLHYDLDDFADVLDPLRDEKPMFLFWTVSDAGAENGITSWPEPAGEGE